MKTINQYQEDIRKLMAKSDDIDAQATVENRDLSTEELDMKNELLNEVTRLRGIVNTLNRQEKMRMDLEKPHTPVSGPAPVDPKTYEVGENNKSKQKFGSLGQQMGAIMSACKPGGHVDPRLYNQPKGATGLSESVPSDGGFLVQQDFSEQLLQDLMQTGILAPMCRRVPISGNANSMKINGVDETSRATGSRQGGIRGYWADEADEKTASKPKFRKIELNLNKLVGLCYATDELLSDASALEGIIRQGFASEFGFLVDDAIIAGTGAGQPLGVTNSGALVTVGAEAGQDADTVVAENIINMYARLFAASRPNAVWLVNQTVEPELMKMSIGVGTGGNLVYMPPGGLSDSPYGRLLGIPVRAIEQCSALGDLGDIILGDFRNGYILAEKGGIESAMSIHVRFIYDESVFRFVLRIDGQPVRATPLTPYKGNTLSHFVTLAAR